MRKELLALVVTTAIAIAAVPTSARSMTAGIGSGIQAALADISLLEEARYVCRHRVHTSRRVCWWRPGPYRGWRWRRWRWR